MNAMTRGLLLALMLVMLGGCVARSYDSDPQFGLAVQGNRTLLMANPAGIPPSGPQGLDGPSSRATMDRYIATFVTPPPPVNVFSIGMGTAGSAPMTVPAALGTSPY